MTRTWIGIAASALLVACGGGSEHCVSGITIECPCLGGGMGVQVCQSDGTFGACQCAEPDAGHADAGGGTDSGIDAGSTPDDAGPPDSGEPDGGDPCAGHVTYAGMIPNAGPVWGALPSSGGSTGLEAGNAACEAIGADHACDYLEVVAAEEAGELATIPAGTTAWLQRTTTVNVGGVDSPAGPGGNCNNWTYATNHIGDGEYITFDSAGTPTYHFDNDTIYDGTDPSHAIVGDLQCGGVTRAILCCYPACGG